MIKQYYSYEEFLKDSKTLAKMSATFDSDAILAVARGGLTLGHFIASIHDNRNLFTINSISYEKDQQLSSIEIFNVPNLENFKRVLLVDDIVDSGKTLKEILDLLKNKYPNVEFKTASLFYKKTASIKADFTIHEAKNWIDFFWEVDI